MPGYVHVTGALVGFPERPFPICFISPVGLTLEAEVLEIAKISDADGRWSLLLTPNAKYNISVLTYPDRVFLGSTEISTSDSPLRGVEIQVDPLSSDS
ncbi:hypothetical protein [Branchiibius sp. NY16-3462-2]|uniref:hypothetical protein n=1 Tax=Branchiibius sp. NY16-3462-2 TaxID=1807500 RepID=UPI0007949D5B|nr:hypothetical protein [Branchiibius sp. NY16-3462-2]KYH42931.1 hypothetical protein AZH51_01245 [Branchiibius sp. NY16-3462-2]